MKRICLVALMLSAPLLAQQTVKYPQPRKGDVVYTTVRAPGAKARVLTARR